MRRAVLLFAAAVCVAAASMAASAQDFQKSYPLKAGGRISVTNMSGNVKVVGYDGDAVVVTGFKEGRDGDMVEVEDRSGGDSVEVGVRYPKHCNCDASIRFEVKIPASGHYELDKVSSMSGDVEISDIQGRVRASTMSGNVTIANVAGTVDASSMSGDVDVSLSRVEGSGNMTFNSQSGNVNVRLPESAGVNVSMSTVSGSVSTDFPIEVHQEEYGSGMWARGRLGDGSRSLTAKSMSGDVHLKHY